MRQPYVQTPPQEFVNAVKRNRNQDNATLVAKRVWIVLNEWLREKDCPERRNLSIRFQSERFWAVFRTFLCDNLSYLISLGYKTSHSYDPRNTNAQLEKRYSSLKTGFMWVNKNAKKSQTLDAKETRRTIQDYENMMDSSSDETFQPDQASRDSDDEDFTRASPSNIEKEAQSLDALNARSTGILPRQVNLTSATLPRGAQQTVNNRSHSGPSGGSRQDQPRATMNSLQTAPLVFQEPSNNPLGPVTSSVENQRSIASPTLQKRPAPPESSDASHRKQLKKDAGICFMQNGSTSRSARKNPYSRNHIHPRSTPSSPQRRMTPPMEVVNRDSRTVVAEEPVTTTGTVQPETPITGSNEKATAREKQKEVDKNPATAAPVASTSTRKDTPASTTQSGSNGATASTSRCPSTCYSSPPTSPQTTNSEIPQTRTLPNVVEATAAQENSTTLPQTQPQIVHRPYDLLQACTIQITNNYNGCDRCLVKGAPAAAAHDPSFLKKIFQTFCQGTGKTMAQVPKLWFTLEECRDTPCTITAYGLLAGEGVGFQEMIAETVLARAKAAELAGSTAVPNKVLAFRVSDVHPRWSKWFA